MAAVHAGSTEQNLCPDESATENVDCIEDEDCICANSTSHTRELVNVSLEGVGCYACELTRTPACTEAADQCTPEPCECGDPNLVKRSATTVDGAPCKYCENPNAAASWPGSSEVTIAALMVLAAVTFHFFLRRPAGGVRSSVRLARRGANRNKVIRVREEQLSLWQQFILLLYDAWDSIRFTVECVCSAAACVWTFLASTCSWRRLVDKVSPSLPAKPVFSKQKAQEDTLSKGAAESTSSNDAHSAAVSPASPPKAGNNDNAGKKRNKKKGDAPPAKPTQPAVVAKDAPPSLEPELVYKAEEEHPAAQMEQPVEAVGAVEKEEEEEEQNTAQASAEDAREHLAESLPPDLPPPEACDTGGDEAPSQGESMREETSDADDCDEEAQTDLCSPSAVGSAKQLIARNTFFAEAAEQVPNIRRCNSDSDMVHYQRP
mmetsp:Transcript_28199/g.65191  ORF Transcript_28199/g.65191 Transcript_28199/m.65191 type:complete len:433 (+) Transcript_28199:30-1328(+)